jgi:hypothetical protein
MDFGMGALRRLLKEEEGRATCEGYDPHMWALVFDVHLSKTGGAAPADRGRGPGWYIGKFV